MITLSDNERQTVEAILKKYAIDQKYKVVVFGSRINGTARKYSDVDLALIGDQTVPIRTISLLAEAFENSKLPYTVDIVDFTQAGKALQQEIKANSEELIQL